MLSEAQGGTGGITRDLQNSLREDLRPLSLTRGSFDIRLGSDWLQLSHFALVWDDEWLFLFMVFWRWFLMKNLDWNPVKNSCIRTTSKRITFLWFSQNGLNAVKPASIHVWFFLMGHEKQGGKSQNGSKCFDFVSIESFRDFWISYRSLMGV